MHAQHCEPKLESGKVYTWSNVALVTHVNSLKHAHHQHIQIRVPPSYQNARNSISWRIGRPKYAHQAMLKRGHRKSLSSSVVRVPICQLQVAVDAVRLVRHSVQGTCTFHCLWQTDQFTFAVRYALNWDKEEHEEDRKDSKAFGCTRLYQRLLA